MPLAPTPSAAQVVEHAPAEARLVQVLVGAGCVLRHGVVFCQRATCSRRSACHQLRYLGRDRHEGSVHISAFGCASSGFGARFVFAPASFIRGCNGCSSCSSKGAGTLQTGVAFLPWSRGLKVAEQDYGPVDGLACCTSLNGSFRCRGLLGREWIGLVVRFARRRCRWIPTRNCSRWSPLRRQRHRRSKRAQPCADTDLDRCSD